jgi:hypothetical protein
MFGTFVYQQIGSSHDGRERAVEVVMICPGVLLTNKTYVRRPKSRRCRNGKYDESWIHTLRRKRKNEISIIRCVLWFSMTSC